MYGFTGETQTEKTLLFYYMIAAVVLLLLNALVFPAIQERSIQEVGYSDFLKGLDQKEIEEVELEQDVIYYTTKKGGEETVYKTGRIPDDGDLVTRLYDSGAKFAEEIPTKQSPILTCCLAGLSRS